MGHDLGAGRPRHLLRRDRVRTRPSPAARAGAPRRRRNGDRPCGGVSPAQPRQLGGTHRGGNGCVRQPGRLARVCGTSQVELGSVGNAPLSRGDGDSARTHRVVRCRDSRRSTRACGTVCGRLGVLVASGGRPHDLACIGSPTGTRTYGDPMMTSTLPSPERGEMTLNDHGTFAKLRMMVRAATPSDGPSIERARGAPGRSTS